MKWAGFEVKYSSHISHIKDESKYVYTEDFKGVRWWNIRSALKRIGHKRFNVRLYRIIELERLVKHVRNGGAFILRHSMSKVDAHYTTVVLADDGKNFNWINMGHKTEMTISPEAFERQVMRTQSFDDQPLALMIRKI